MDKDIWKISDLIEKLTEIKNTAGDLVVEALDIYGEQRDDVALVQTLGVSKHGEVLVISSGPQL